MRGRVQRGLARTRRACVGLLPLALATALAACGRAGPEFLELRLYAMATWVDLSLPAAATREHPELIADIEAELREFEVDFYAWADGELAALNAALSAGGSFEVSPAMIAMLVAAQQAANDSDGAFEPGVGALVELWGFHDATAAPPPTPDAGAIAAVLAATGSIRDLRFDGRRISAPLRRYALDLGALAKGAAVDSIVARLAALDIEPALVNAGGSLRALGEHDDRSWRIGIQAPRGEGLLGSLVLAAGEAAASSGDYERFRESAGLRLHHILDPRTGQPVAHTQAVTAVAADALTADAASTALFVAGPEAWREVADRMGVTAALRVDASGRIEMTPAMRDRFQPGTSGTSAIIAVVD